MWIKIVDRRINTDKLDIISYYDDLENNSKMKYKIKLHFTSKEILICSFVEKEERNNYIKYLDELLDTTIISKDKKK